MSCNYAEGLSPYPDKGQLGMPERFAGKEEVSQKVAELAALMKASRHTVFHTGAGISTSAGIPDFRGPKGVWTLEKKGLKPDVNVSFDDARPTFTHMALVALEKAGLIQYLVTQNIDGLHLRSGFPRRKMAELHGNMYLDKCSVCKREFVRNTAVSTVGQKTSGVGCIGKRDTGRRCRGRLHDNILDWEHDLPHLDYNLAEKHSTASDLSVCLGTTLQIIPSGVLPTIAKQSGGKLVICNLQPTKHDKISDLIINGYVDDVMRELLSLLNVRCSEYSIEQDPVLITRALQAELKDAADPIEWTIPDEWFDDRDLLEKVHRNKQIASANNTANKRTPRPGKMDRRKRRSLIKEDHPSAAAGQAQEEEEESKGGDEIRPLSKAARSNEEISDRNRRYNRGRKRQSEDVESAGEQSGDDKVKLQRLDDCGDDKEEVREDKDMQVDDFDCDKGGNVPPSNENKEELKSESDSSELVKIHVLLENVSKDSSSVVNAEFDCSLIKFETQGTRKKEDSTGATSLLQPEEETSSNGPTSSSVTGSEIEKSSKNSLNNNLNATSFVSSAVKEITSTDKTRSCVCDVSEEGRASISHNISSIGCSIAISSSVSQLSSPLASCNESFVRDSGCAPPNHNDSNKKTTVENSNTGGEPTLMKQKLCQSLPESTQSIAKSDISNSTTLSETANQTQSPPITTSASGGVFLQQAESNSKRLDNSPSSTIYSLSTNETASVVGLLYKNEIMETQSSFTDQKKLSKSGNGFQKSSDSTGTAITKENNAADKSTDYSIKETSDISLETNESDLISNTISSIRLTASQQVTDCKRTDISGLGITSKRREDEVCSETKGSSTHLTETSEGTKRDENYSAINRCVSKHVISNDILSGDNMPSSELIGKNVSDIPKSENPIQVLRAIDEAEGSTTTKEATMNELRDQGGTEDIKSDALSPDETGKYSQ